MRARESLAWVRRLEGRGEKVDALVDRIENAERAADSAVFAAMKHAEQLREDAKAARKLLAKSLAPIFSEAEIEAAKKACAVPAAPEVAQA